MSSTVICTFTQRRKPLKTEDAVMGVNQTFNILSITIFQKNEDLIQANFDTGAYH